MKTLILAVVAGSVGFLGVQAKAHEGCNEDRVTQVDHYRGADVTHYDHHHYGYDEDGNEVVVHHDHHYVVPSHDYGDRRDRRHDSHRNIRFFFGF